MIEIPKYNGVGIYAITDTETGKRYIGSSKNVRKRLRLHLTMAAKLKEPPKLQALFNSCAPIKFEVIEKIPDGSTLEYVYDRERYYIQHYDCIDNGYNSALPIDVAGTILTFEYILQENRAKNRACNSIESHIRFEIERYRTPIH